MKYYWIAFVIEIKMASHSTMLNKVRFHIGYTFIDRNEYVLYCLAVKLTQKIRSFLLILSYFRTFLLIFLSHFIDHFYCFLRHFIDHFYNIFRPSKSRPWSYNSLLFTCKLKLNNLRYCITGLTVNHISIIIPRNILFLLPYWQALYTKHMFTKILIKSKPVRVE